MLTDAGITLAPAPQARDRVAAAEARLRAVQQTGRGDEA